MQAENKTRSTNSVQVCQNCQKDFTIEPDDFGFYEKMGINVPKMCPECRSQRRSIFRNERFLYKRQCGLCKKEIISMYSPKKYDDLLPALLVE